MLYFSSLIWTSFIVAFIQWVTLLADNSPYKSVCCVGYIDFYLLLTWHALCLFYCRKHAFRIRYFGISSQWCIKIFYDWFVLNATSKEEPTALELEDFAQFIPRIQGSISLNPYGCLKCSKQEKNKNFDIRNCLIGSYCVTTLSTVHASKLISYIFRQKDINIIVYNDCLILR